MQMTVADVCGNKDWPMAVCAEGSQCLIWGRWYRQCVPSDIELRCPVTADNATMPGGYSINTDTPKQLVRLHET